MAASGKAAKIRLKAGYNGAVPKLLRPRLTLHVFSILFILTSAGICVEQYNLYRGLPETYPQGTIIARVDVSGLNREQAGQRIEAEYSLPVEFQYQDSVFQATPSDLGFHLDLETMLNGVKTTRAASFWDFLWQHVLPAGQSELKYSLDKDQLRDYLKNEVAARYDQVPVAPQPVPGSLEFKEGHPGTVLQVDEAVAQTEAALLSPGYRRVNLAAKALPAPKMGMDRLQDALIQVLRLDDFHGLAEVSAIDISNQQRLDLTIQDQQVLSAPVAFTAASTIKIPVMISVFRRLPEPAPETDLQLIRNMIEASDNPSTDLVVQTVIDATRGPLDVTSDLQALGYANTFWAGYFYDGAPLLEKFETPANRSPAYDVHPDIYNQTTSTDMADLLSEIERCARDGSGKLTATFPGEISQTECQQMIDILKGNWLPVLIKAGLPEGTSAGHKHGWISGPDDIVHTFSDVALVESPGTTYSLAIYLYSDEQLLFDPTNLLFARLSRVVYNFFNTP